MSAERPGAASPRLHPGEHGAPERGPHDAPDGGAGRGGPQQHRLFVAVWPGSNAIAHLAAHLASEGPASADLRWQPEERWHVTLAFLGARAPTSAQRRLARIPLPASAPIRLAGAGAFGPTTWIGVEHGPWLAQIAHEVQVALDVPDRRFRAHVTVARARGRNAVPTARDAAAQLARYEGPPWQPEAITLVRSVAGPMPRYEIIAELPLRSG